MVQKTSPNISEITDLLVSVTHGKYVMAEYIRDPLVLSQRPSGQGCRTGPHRSLAMAGYATQPLVGADSVNILIYQLALLYKR